MASQRIIVIGGVAAGPAAAAQAGRTDPEAQVVLFEEGRDVSYGACEMPYLLGGSGLAPDDLVVLSRDELIRTRGVDTRILHRVESIDAARSRLMVRDLVSDQTTEERFDKLILATGARVKWPAIEGLTGSRVHSFRTLSDAQTVQAHAVGGSARWVVIGGGFIGLEVADQLAAAGHRVTILAPRGPMAGRLDPSMTKVLDASLAAAGIAVRRARAVGVRRDAPGAPIAVRCVDGELVGADRVIVATGTAPNSDLAAQSGLKIGVTGGIKTDDGMRTSASLIWACGDCLESIQMVSGRPAHIPLSPLAFRTGRVAGQNAARSGRQTGAHFAGSVGAYGLKVAGLELAFAGLSAEEARVAGFDPVTATIAQGSRASHMPDRHRIHVHLVVDRRSRRLLGGQLAGVEGAAARVNVLVPLLRTRGTIDDLHDLDLVYAPPFSPSQDPLTVAARAVQKILVQTKPRPTPHTRNR
jgi:NADPH-dependent 2,4-dienoyl-CoA reductase/sulfur reductase-like enzyme